MEINIKNVSMTYPNGKQALKNLSLWLHSPSLVGLLGPNGAGKSTLMKLLSAALLPTSGVIEIDGHPLPQAEKSLKARLGYLPQDFGLFDELTVEQFLEYMAALKGISSRDGISSRGSTSSPSSAASHNTFASRHSAMSHHTTTVKDAICAVNLEEKSKSRIRTLSGGQRQRTGIAQALLGCPDFLILDEPTVGLDPEERIRFRNLFSHAAQDRLVLLSTHIIEDVQSVCNQLIVMNHGKILFSGTPEELIQSASGHVGVFWEKEAQNNHTAPRPLCITEQPLHVTNQLLHVTNKTLHITARINTANGVRCRAVADTLPPFAQPEEPSLEDAYLYLISREVTQ